MFSDDYSTQQLFSNCPVLEELSLEVCSWENLKFVSICAPKLLGLIIFEGSSELSSASDGCQITVVELAWNIFISGEFLNEYIFVTLPRMITLRLNFLVILWRDLGFLLTGCIRSLEVSPV